MLIRGNMGHNVTVPCPIPLSNTCQELRWYKETNTTQIIYNIDEWGHRSSKKEKYHADPNTGMLTIIDAEPLDAAVYTCRVVADYQLKSFKITVELGEEIQADISKCMYLLLHKGI